MEGQVPMIVVLAFGAGALGGPDALRFLLAFAGRNPLVDIAICLLVLAMVTAHLLGAVTLARFVRKARPGASDASGAPAANIFDQVTLVLSVCAGFFVAACLVVVPLVASGDPGSVSLLAAVLGVGAAAAFPCIRPLLRMFRNAGNAGAAVPVARATGRFGAAIRRKVRHLKGSSLVAGGLVLVLISGAAHGGRDTPRLFPGFNNNNNTFAGVAVSAVVGIPLLVRFSRSAAVNAGVAAPGRATNAGSFGKLTRVASLALVVSSTLIYLLVTAYAPPP